MNEFWNSFTREKTDEQYNPILWTQRLATEDLLSTHIELTTNKSETYRNQMAASLNIVHFGEDEFSGSIDVFRPDNVRENASIVVYIHGGWWQWFSKEQFSFLAEPFNRHGFAVYMPGYRMAQDWGNGAPMESILTQMECATVTILKEAVAQDAPAVYLVGHSAGGHLVTMLHRTDWSKFDLPDKAHQKIKSVFSLAGLFDIRPLVNSFVNDEIGMSMEAAEKVSPQLKPSSSQDNLCPLHLILPELDTPEFFRQTKEYQNKLLQSKQACHLVLAKGRDHLDIIENLVDDEDEILTYILKHMQETVRSE